MTKLLNRIAHLISFLMGFVIIFSFVTLIGELKYLGDDEILLFLFFSIIFGLIFKAIFLSKNFIEERISHFNESSQKLFLKNNSLLNSLPLQGKEEQNVVSREEEIKEIEKKYDKLEIIEEDNEKESKSNMEATKEIEAEILEKERINLEKIKLEKVKKKKEEIVEEESEFSKYFKGFFKENLLAKIGAILVFLGVLFLLSLIWNEIPNMLKLIFGFIIGFAVYYTGVFLDKKEIIGESRIMLGTGILINFLVILAGKYILEDNINSGAFLSSWVTLVFLILNTIFGIVTSLVYKSKTLLIFSFLAAYIVPFLLGESENTPYNLVSYSMIVSLGALFIAKKQKDMFLAVGAFVLGNILFLLAPINTELHFAVKFIASAILSFITIKLAYTEKYKDTLGIFVTTYVFLILSLIIGSENSLISGNFSFITYLFSILFFFGIGIFLFIKKVLVNIFTILLFPLLIIIGLIFSGDLNFIEITLGIFVLAYLVAFNFISAIISPIFKYLFFGILGGFIFLINSFLSFNISEIGLFSYLSVIVVSFVFIITSYLLSKKEDLSYLYSIGTIGGVLILAPVINVDIISNSEIFKETFSLNFVNILSIISIILFGLINTLYIFRNKYLIGKKSNIGNLITGLIIGVLFIGLQLFKYGTLYFPGITMGFAFTALAAYYFLLSYLVIGEFGFNKIKEENNLKNILYGFIGISISIFSLSIALIFSNSPEVVSTIWLFEASILFYFYNKTKQEKIFTAGLVIFIIGVVKLLELNNFVNSGELIFLIPLSIIFASLTLNLKLTNSSTLETHKGIHDITHIIAMGGIGILLLQIIPSTGHGWSLLGISIFVLLMSVFYSKVNSNILKWFLIVGFGFLTINQIASFDHTIYRLDRDNVDYLIALQYISTIIITSVVVLWNKFNNNKVGNKTINIIFALYLLIMLTIYVYNITQNTFAITIFWGIITFISIIQGISKGNRKLRTVGLYLLLLVLVKIFLYDVWFGLDDAVSRVVALISIGVLLIFTSTQYSKKYGNDLVGEFSLSNLSDNKKELNNFTKEIKKIDLEGITNATFKVDGKVAFTTKSKNILQIVIYVVKQENKTSFKSNELTKYYDYIVNNYTSELNKRDYTTATTTFKKFVEKGGEVILK